MECVVKVDRIVRALLCKCKRGREARKCVRIKTGGTREWASFIARIGVERTRLGVLMGPCHLLQFERTLSDKPSLIQF